MLAVLAVGAVSITEPGTEAGARAADAGGFTTFRAPLQGATDFLTGFPSCSGSRVGPVGLLFDPKGAIVTDACGMTYRFPLTGGDASRAPVRVHNELGRGLAISKGRYYAVGAPGGRWGLYLLDPSTLALGPMVAPVDGDGRAVVTDPATGDLYVSSSHQIARIAGPGSSHPAVSTFARGDYDGLYFTSNGARLYAADYSRGHLSGFTRAGQLTLDVDLHSHGPDGVAVAKKGANGAGVPVSDNVFVNSNDGTVERIDVNHDNQVSVVASGGSRGDFATVGPDGCLYATQSDRIVLLEPCFFQISAGTLSRHRSLWRNPLVLTVLLVLAGAIVVFGALRLADVLSRRGPARAR